MAVFYVFQGETYKHERAGGFVWSPQKNKNGGKNVGYSTMEEIHKGDFILHNYNGKIVAISIAESDCYVADQPETLITAEKSITWNIEGFMVKCTYYDFDVPLKTKGLTQWLADHYVVRSAFTLVGRGKQQYMCHLAYEHAVFLLEESIKLQHNSEIGKKLRAVLSDIIIDKDSEYDSLEMDEINDLIDHSTLTKRPEWPGKIEQQTTTISSDTKREIPKRNPQRAADALAHAEYKCEYDPNDRTFLRKNGTLYTEPHHLIPISRYREFKYSVDVMENIVSLCSHCHNLLHYGRIEDKKVILAKLFKDRQNALHNVGLDIYWDLLVSYYE